MKSKKTFTGCFALRSISYGESLAGYIAGHRYSSLSPLRAQLWSLVGKTTSGGTVWFLPTNLNLISSELGELVGSADSLLNNNTLFPAFRRFLSVDDCNRLKEHHTFAGVRGIACTLGVTGKYSTGRRFMTCAKCLIEDIAVDGRPFWRRDFFMPGVEYCSKHEAPLQAVCSTCPTYRKAKAMGYPGIKCSCATRMSDRRTPLPASEVESEIDISRGISRLLDSDYLAKVGQQDVIARIRVQASSLGLVDDGEIRRRRLAEFLDDSRHSRLLGRKFFHAIDNQKLGRVLAGKTSLRNPVSVVALLRTLFGTWEAAEQALEERSRIEINSKPALEISLPRQNKKELGRFFPRPESTKQAQFESMYRKYIDMYRALRKKHPDSSHSQLLNRMPAKAERLTRKRLEQANEDIPSERYGDGYYAALDQSLVQHIHEAHTRLRGAAYEMRISRNLLLKGHRMVSIWKKIEGRLPAAKVALSECEESFSDFRRRRLRQLVKIGKVSTISPDSATSVDALDDILVSQLLRRARNN